MQYSIVDTHFHIWERKDIPIEWIKHTKFDRDFSFEDYLKAYENIHLIGGVYIEIDSSDKQKEFAYISNLARQKNKILGIVTHTDTYLESIGVKKICGVREVLHTAKSTKINDKKFLETLSQIAKTKDFVFEACILSDDIPELAKLAKEFKNLKIVLNHFGNPDIQNLENYKKDLLLLRDCTNVYCKLSPSDHFDLQISQEKYEKLFAIVFEIFGKERMVFGSNYPVSSFTPKEWLEITTKNLKKLKLSDLDISKIYKDNAYLLYSISLPLQRFGQVIKIKKEKLDEYIALHSNVWKGVNDALKKSNIQNYSIYHYKDFLFAYFEYVGEDFAKDMEKIAQDPITKEWWKCTDPCQVSLSKTQQWLDIQEVFHLD